MPLGSFTGRGPVLARNFSGGKGFLYLHSAEVKSNSTQICRTLSRFFLAQLNENEPQPLTSIRRDRGFSNGCNSGSIWQLLPRHIGFQFGLVVTALRFAHITRLRLVADAFRAALVPQVDSPAG